MALINVRVTILEPGGFRTDFAGVSTSLHEGRAEYDSVVGAAARQQHGNQPDDPARAAQVILNVATMPKPPLRPALGDDAIEAIEAAGRRRLAELAQLRDLSVSTNFS
jgi:hypothetical protein